MIRVLVCGDRKWQDKEAIRRELNKFPPNTVIIEGEARGADSLAREVSEELGFTVLKFPADWNRFGRAAGPIRNHQMLKEGRPDLVLAFHQDLTKSRGTKDMINVAKQNGIETKVIEK